MMQTIVQQLTKSGQTIFSVNKVLANNIRFAPASLLAQLRRDVLAKLELKRIATHKVQPPFMENNKAKFHSTILTEQENVTNQLSHQFYTDHGATVIAEGIDLKASTQGCRVMITDYCIRREMGQCLLQKPTIKGELYLERGRKKYKLSFDCKRCQMSLTDII